MSKYDLKVGDWVKVEVDNFIYCERAFREFYRHKVARIYKFVTSTSVILDTPSYYSGSPHGGRAHLSIKDLEKIEPRQLTFTFTE
jgi:hypothetical protein